MVDVGRLLSRSEKAREDVSVLMPVDVRRGRDVRSKRVAMAPMGVGVELDDAQV